MEPLVGFEPTTHALQVRCSTTELKRHEAQYTQKYRDFIAK